MPIYHYLSFDNFDANIQSVVDIPNTQTFNDNNKKPPVLDFNFEDPDKKVESEVVGDDFEFGSGSDTGRFDESKVPVPSLDTFGNIDQIDDLNGTANFKND